jgi:2-hydroxychromene-2-carboxylate isomerase
MIEQRSRTIDYYVWLLSDWAYLGGVRFMRIAHRHGIRVNHIPMRMQDVFAGSGGIALANRSWQRQAYRIEELKRWRARLGMSLNIEPRYFPADIDLASCMVIAGQRCNMPVGDFVNAVMRAIWAEDQNPADPAVLTAIAHNLGPIVTVMSGWERSTELMANWHYEAFWDRIQSCLRSWR